ncbi:MAG: hypothetical protein ACXWC4_00995 [Telluria sp.]
MKKILACILLLLETFFSLGATQPPPDPDPIFKFNWIELERDPVPLCSSTTFPQCIGVSKERCNAVARDQIRIVNKEVRTLAAGKGLNGNEVADYRQYAVEQFLHRLRLHLTNMTAYEFMNCVRH